MLNNPKDFLLCSQMLRHIEVVPPLKDNVSPQACHNHWEIFFTTTSLNQLIS